MAAIRRFEVSLAQTPVSHPVRVTGIRGAGRMTYRLMEMGLIEGAHVEVLGRAPFGDPLHLRLGNPREGQYSVNVS